MKVLYSVFATAILAVLLSASATTVFAQDARSQLIASRCSQLISDLGDIQRRDLVSRTNMGREYENTDKQLDAFTQRVHNNNFNEQPFAQLLTQYREAVTKFRINYVTYDDSLNALLAIECQDNPSVFSTQLEKTRAQRLAVNSAIDSASSYIAQYRALMVQLQNDVPQELSR